MGGTKFMVIKFRELLKTAVFAILGVILIIAIIYFIIPKDSSTALYEPGTYTASIVLDNETVNVQVTVNKQKIKDISLVHTTETLPVFYPLFEETVNTVGSSILKAQSLDVDVPPDASITAKLIIDAVEDTLEQASVKNVR